MRCLARRIWERDDKFMVFEISWFGLGVYFPSLLSLVFLIVELARNNQVNAWRNRNLNWMDCDHKGLKAPSQVVALYLFLVCLKQVYSVLLNQVYFAWIFEFTFLVPYVLTIEGLCWLREAIWPSHIPSVALSAQLLMLNYYVVRVIRLKAFRRNQRRTLHLTAFFMKVLRWHKSIVAVSF